MVTLPSHPISTNFGTWSYQCLLSICPYFLAYMLKCSGAHILSCLFTYCSFATVGHADAMCYTVSSNCLQRLHLLSVVVVVVVIK